MPHKWSMLLLSVAGRILRAPPFLMPHVWMPREIPRTVNTLNLTAVMYYVTVDGPDRIWKAESSPAGGGRGSQRDRRQLFWPMGVHGRNLEPRGVQSRPQLTASRKMGGSVPSPQGHGFRWQPVPLEEDPDETHSPGWLLDVSPVGLRGQVTPFPDFWPRETAKL